MEFAQTPSSTTSSNDELTFNLVFLDDANLEFVGGGTITNTL